MYGSKYFLTANIIKLFLFSFEDRREYEQRKTAAVIDLVSW